MTAFPITSAPWGDATLYTLRNAQGMRVTISDLGATMVNWFAPDRSGRMADVLLGWNEQAQYRDNSCYFGSVVGRWANRIRDGRFTLDGVDYQVDQNQGQTHLHGGHTGFHHRRWHAKTEGDTLHLSLVSPEGDAGFPGTLHTEVSYRLDDEGTLLLDYCAVSDAATPVNLTSHAYFNLNGGEAGIGDHLIQIDADEYLKIDSVSIPVEQVDVAGSAFDFRQPAPIGTRLDWPDGQLALASGFDHCYCLNGEANRLRPVATVYDPTSGRELTVATSERGLQFYTGNFLDGVAGRRDYRSHDGFCLEAQAYPDQVNGADAERAILRPGEMYRQQTSYRLGVRR